MTAHVHTWVPIAGMAGRYSCACNVTGYRAFSGEIRVHKTMVSRRAEVTVRPYLDSDGRIPPKPTSRG